MEVWISPDGRHMAVVAASWELNPKITFEGLADQFEKNPVTAWQNYGSVLLKTQGAVKALRDPSVLQRFASKYRKHPWDPVVDDFSPLLRGVPGRRYFVHIDQSKSGDSTGIAVVHREPGTPRWVVDLMLEIAPAKGHNIDYEALRSRFVFHLQQKRDFTIASVSYDGWQSEEARQQLEKAGYDTNYVSVDRSRAPYDTLIELLNLDRLDFYEYPPFAQQMEELELVKGLKYDHPKKFRDGTIGRKDVSDAVAGAIFNGFTWERDHPEEPGIIHVHRNQALTRPDRYYERR